MDVLYGEADVETIRRVEEHQAACGSCREEMEALRRLRHDFRAWKLPELHRLRFPRRRAARRLAAAAVMVLALGGGLGLSGTEVRFEDGHFAFRLGRAAGDSERLLAEQEARHRTEMESLRAALAGAPALDEPAVLRRVEEMIRASEQRQALAMRTSLLELGERTEARRRYDLARVAAGLSYLDGRAGQNVARTTELMGYVLEASQKR
jgi:hypothetical protein